MVWVAPVVEPAVGAEQSAATEITVAEEQPSDCAIERNENAIKLINSINLILKLFGLQFNEIDR